MSFFEEKAMVVQLSEYFLRVWMNLTKPERESMNKKIKKERLTGTSTVKTVSKQELADVSSRLKGLLNMLC